MARPKKVTESGEKPKNSIDNLDSLSKEFINNKMIPRKAEFLKIRLIELLKSNKITDDEMTLLEKVLKRERAKSLLSDANIEVLNRIEIEYCTETCRCKDENPPRVFFVVKDQVCKFFRQEPVGAEDLKFIVFVEKKIPPSHQLTLELVEKKEMGHAISQDEYPKEKILLHRLELNEGWFNMIFEVEEDLLTAEPTSTDEVFKF